MSDCSNHKKELFGIGDMRVVAERISELHYEALAELMAHLGTKLYNDGQEDWEAGRKKLGHNLVSASSSIQGAHFFIDKAWQISKPFMNDKPTQL